MARKNPSPLSLPIARIRATGATVGHGISHNPNAAAPYSRIHLIVTEPDGTRTAVEHAGCYYQRAVDALNRIADRRERGEFYLWDTVIECPAVVGYNYALTMGTLETATRFMTAAAAVDAATKAAPVGVLTVRRAAR